MPRPADPGPSAPTGPRALVLVEGDSDRIAVDTLAASWARDLAAERVAVVPIGGAHAARRFTAEHAGVPMVALADRAEAGLFLRVLAAERVHVCVADLEDELIRAVGAERVVDVLRAQGDLRRFRTMQQQAAWNGRPLAAQLRRWIGSGARRKARYAQLLTAAAVECGRVPAPLERVLSASCSDGGGDAARAPGRPGGR